MGSHQSCECLMWKHPAHLLAGVLWRSGGSRRSREEEGLRGRVSDVRGGATEGPAYLCSLLQDRSKSSWCPSQESRGSLMTPILWMTVWGKRVAPWFRVKSRLVMEPGIELSTGKMPSRLSLWMWTAEVVSACPRGLWFAREACSGHVSPAVCPHSATCRQVS